MVVSSCSEVVLTVPVRDPRFLGRRPLFARYPGASAEELDQFERDAFATSNEATPSAAAGEGGTPTDRPVLSLREVSFLSLPQGEAALLDDIESGDSSEDATLVRAAIRRASLLTAIPDHLRTASDNMVPTHELACTLCIPSTGDPSPSASPSSSSSSSSYLTDIVASIGQSPNVWPAGHGRDLVVIVHGVLGHRDNLFFPLLSQALADPAGFGRTHSGPLAEAVVSASVEALTAPHRELDELREQLCAGAGNLLTGLLPAPTASLRVDLRGHGRSPGLPSYSDYEGDFIDISAAIAAAERHGWRVVGLIGHSRGGVCVMRQAARKPPHSLRFVASLGSRFNHRDITIKHTAAEVARMRPAPEGRGWFGWRYRSRIRGEGAVIVSPSQIDLIATDVNLRAVSAIPSGVDTLTMHGLGDTVVLPTEAMHYTNALLARGHPAKMGVHTLRLIPDADHLFRGFDPLVVSTILGWLSPALRAARASIAHPLDSCRSSRSPVPTLSVTLASNTPEPPPGLSRHEAQFHVHWSGVDNFRDLGGYPLAGADPSARQPTIHCSPIRRATVSAFGRVFRAAGFSDVRPEALQHLHDALRVRAVVDLRSQYEFDRDHAHLGPLFARTGIVHFHAPVFADPSIDRNPTESFSRRWASHSKCTNSMVSGYMDILSHGVAAFRALFSLLAGPPFSDAYIDQGLLRAGLPVEEADHYAVVFHCTAGKDRTGVASALLLDLLGASPAAICRDYQRTEVCLDRRPFIERLLPNPDGGLESSGLSPHEAFTLSSSRWEAMAMFVSGPLAELGGAEVYLREHCGLPAEAIAALRRRLVQTVPASSDACR
ncbi:hypothetical protein H696_00330 [Fonticula alba]|uniref:Serine aminopeptidase S33 domain-containing protein n=1 Tax=Fonticula alba TaxID=691883 RepID=A0A058ZFM1_FONAL|nr:hypothetical protein H696_00330 [Fonticula alba]KCV72751.1 hypothetical protein H696_00330 [Fonticula alba]|eukprot:XP_009492452.1 hypothetical protein H696_00330 [Fonticula alba]